ncbi:NAD-dependent epimerase/dehydratase family protein [Arthrobacter sp. 35W]|uniref:NAD-dependent epimerase/dehydratase family protein n=1 Tax=Arthrobacter sp. 35W TaxID=1132441 RepID=UPI000421FD90|nr:NAD-dependent epimerase/dehydratase family protein [Arthrobacter sp. 35W]
MRIVVIGATGHIGSYLVPRLAAAGHHVVALSRGRRGPYHPDPAWDGVERIAVDRAAEDAAGVFGARVAALEPDAVVDLLCFTEDSARELVAALHGTGAMLLSCGTIWVHGHATEVPATEDAPRNAFDDYGMAKAAIESYLLEQSNAGGVPAVVLHPGHICGPGWPVVNPVGNFDLSVWERLAAGEPVVVPMLGLETVHHVHADDVAQAFHRALLAPAAIGQSFHTTSERALTLRGFAEAVAGWFGRGAVLAFAPFQRFEDSTTAEHAAASLDHVAHSPSMSIAKAHAILGYEPRYTSLAAVAESVRWLAANGRIKVPTAEFGPPVPPVSVVPDGDWFEP